MTRETRMNVQRTCIKVTLFGSHGAEVKDKNLHQFPLPSTKGLHPFSLLVLLLPLVTKIARHVKQLCIIRGGF